MKRARGFNLLELIIASLIFSFITIAMMGVWGTYAKMTGKARGMLVGTHLAERVMEDQLALGWQAEPILETENRTFVMVQTVDDGTIEISYHYWVDVVDMSTMPHLGLKQITVHVAWQEPSGRREVSCESLVYWGG